MLLRAIAKYESPDSNDADAPEEQKALEFASIAIPGSVGPASGNVPSWATDYLKDFYSKKAANG